MNRCKSRWLLLALIVVAGAVVPASAAEPRPTGGLEVLLVPFSHLDLFWGGTREECLSRGNAIVAKAMRECRRSPRFRFLLEDEVFVANYLDSHAGSPEVEELKRLVKAGQIEIAPKWAAIYQDLTNGEALIRNLAIGTRYAQEVFGVKPLVSHMGDIPGYTPQFPQILQQAGIPYMLMARMGPSDKSLFYWKSPDGSRALVWSSLKSYGWGSSLKIHLGAPSEALRAKFHNDVAQVAATTPGPILMHFGSDLWAAPENFVEKVDQFNAAAPSRLRLATPVEFFREAEQSAGIPELTGEIPSSWPNLLTAMPHMWPQMMPAANTLLTAEKFAAINYALGYAAYPGQYFQRMWCKLLESLDHNQDGQGGLVGDAGKIQLQQTAHIIGDQIINEMLRNLAERVEVPQADCFPIVVFNPMGWKRDDLVRTHVTIFGDDSPASIAAYRKGIRLVDDECRSVAFHVEETSSNISLALQIAFVARGVPSLGYKTYYLVPAEKADEFPQTAKLALDEVLDRKSPRRPLGSDTIENTFFRLTVDRATGRAALFDKQLGRDVCRDMEILALEERGGNYIGIEAPTGRTAINTIDRVFVEENNAVRAVVRVDGRIADIPLTQRLTLYRELKRLDVENTVDWTSHRLMRVRQVFPMIDPQAAIHYGIPFGAHAAQEIMPNAGPHQRDEISTDSWRRTRFVQDWIRTTAGDWGLTIASDHQLFRLEDGAICGDMVRGTRFTSVRVERGQEVTSMHYPPPGRYVFRYSLSSAAGDWKAAKAYRAGMNWNNPLLPVEVADTVSTKSLPAAASFCMLQDDNLVLSAVKKADAGPELIVRLYEIEGRPAAGGIECLGREMAFTETNVLEDGGESSPREMIQAAPFTIKTLKLKGVGPEK